MALDAGVSQAMSNVRYGLGHDWGVYGTFSWLSEAAGRCRQISNDTITSVRRHRIMY